MVARNPFGRQKDNPFARQRPNPFREENPFGRGDDVEETEVAEEFVRPPEDERPEGFYNTTPYGIRMGKRVFAGIKEQVGGNIAGAARDLREPKTIGERAVEELKDTRWKKGSGVGGFAESLAETIKLPVDLAMTTIDEAAQGVVDLLGGKGERAVDEMEAVGEGIFDTAQTDREDAGEFGIRRPEGFEVGQGLKYYGTQMVESLGANMAPAIAMGVLTKGRVNSMNRVLNRRGIKGLDVEAMTQIGGLGTMGLGVYGAEYEKAYRETGGDHEFAVEQGTMRMFAEVIPEILPFGMAMKVAGPLAKAMTKMGGFKGAARQITGGTLAEGASEVLTEILNEVYDVQRLDKEWNWSEFKKQATDAFLVGALMGAVMNVPAAMDVLAAPGETLIKPPGEEAGKAIEDDSQTGAFDLSKMGQLETTIDAGTTQLDQPAQSVGIPTPGISVPTPGMPTPAVNPFGQTEAPTAPIAEPEQTIDTVEPRDVSEFNMDELETDEEFISWADQRVAPMEQELKVMRGETAEQKADAKKWRKENPNARRAPGYNVNEATDNLLTVIAKHGGLETESWKSQHDVDVTGARSKGGENWVASVNQPLFSKHAKAMKPDRLAEWINESGPETYGVPAKYLNEQGLVTANSVGDLIQDAMLNPGDFGGPKFLEAKELADNIERTRGDLELAWHEMQEKRELIKKFETSDPELLDNMELVLTHDEAYYPASWDLESRTLSDWVVEASDIGATEAEIEAATTGKDVPAQVRALNDLIGEKEDDRLEIQIKEAFDKGDIESREEAEGARDEAEEERKKEGEPAPPDPLTEDVTKEQELADAERAKDKERSGDRDKDTVDVTEGEGDLFTGPLADDLFPGTTMEGEKEKPKTKDNNWETGKELGELFVKSIEGDVHTLKSRGAAGARNADEALAAAGYVLIPFGKSTIFVNPEKRLTAFSRSQGMGAGVIVQFGKAKILQVSKANAILKPEATQPTKEKDDGDVSRQEDSGQVQQQQDGEGQLPDQEGQQPGDRPSDQAEGREGEVTETGEGEAVTPPQVDELAGLKSRLQKLQDQRALPFPEQRKLIASLGYSKEEYQEWRNTSKLEVEEFKARIRKLEQAEQVETKVTPPQVDAASHETREEARDFAKAWVDQGLNSAEIYAKHTEIYGRGNPMLTQAEWNEVWDEVEQILKAREREAKAAEAEKEAEVKEKAAKEAEVKERAAKEAEAKKKAAKEAEVKEKAAKAKKDTSKKLENTGADLRRHWDKLKADLEAAKSDGLKAWNLIHAKTQRAKLFNPTPGKGASFGVQRYYDEVQRELYTFSEVVETFFGTSDTRGYYGTPMAEQVAEKIDSDSYAWATTAFLTDMAREYETMIRGVALAISGATNVTEAEAKLAEIIDTNNLSRWRDPNYLDKTLHMSIAARVKGELPRSQGPFSGHGVNTWLRNRKHPETEMVKVRKWEGTESVLKDGTRPMQWSIKLWDLFSNQQTETDKTSKRKKSAHNRIRITSVERNVEKKVRDGNVTPKEFKKEFGFADVGFGSYVLKGRDQAHLNAAWDAFADLADFMKMDRKAIGFFGKMHFTIGALGHGKHAAHFAEKQPHPDGGTVPVINLTNTKGDGAVAHEWGHALDFLGEGDTQYVVDVIKRELAASRTLAELKKKIRRAVRPGGSYMTHSGPKGSLENIQSLARYYMNGRGQATSFKREADKLGKKYWGSDVELFARAWEAFVFDELQGENNYLVNDWVREDGVGVNNGYKGSPYPTAPERANFAGLFRAMMGAIVTDAPTSLKDWTQLAVDSNVSMFVIESAQVLDTEAEQTKAMKNAVLAKSKGKKFGQEVRLDRAKFDATLPPEVQDYQAEAQKIYDSIPELMEEYKQEKIAARKEREEEAQAKEAEKWQKAKEEAAAAERIRQAEAQAAQEDKADAAAAGDVETSVDPDKPLTFEEAKALFNQRLEAKQAGQGGDEAPTKDTEKPTKKWTKTTVVSEPAKETAADLAKKAAELGVEGISDTLKGLAKLFPPSTLQTFPPTFDQETYQKAKPYFAEALVKFREAGRTLGELADFLIDSYGASIADYFAYWVSNEAISQNLKETKTPTAPAPSKGSLEEFIFDQVEEITDNLRLKAVLMSYHGRPVTEAEIKAGQEATELALVRKAQEIVRNPNANHASKFQSLMELYENQPNMTSRSSTSMQNQAYSTPLPLAYLASELSGINSGTTVYEPTAGNGALLIGANPVKTVANELNAQRAQNMRTLGFAVNEFDATAWKPSSSYDAAIMNPPFGEMRKAIRVDGYVVSKIDHAIAAKALENLSNSGRATLIIGAHKDAGKTGQPTKIFLNWLYSHYNVIDHFEVAGELYRKQGAGWPVAVITINGRKGSDSVFDRTVERYTKWSEINEHVTSVLDSKGFTGASTDSTVDSGQRTEDTVTAPEQAGEPADGTGGRRAGEPGGRRTGEDGVRDRPRGDAVRGEPKRGARDRTDTDGERPSGERVPASEQPGAGAAKPSATERVPGSKPPRPADKSNNEIALGSEFQVHYVPGSKGLNEAVLMPVNMATAMESAMKTLTGAVGNLDAFVMKKLGYSSEKKLFDAFMALQVDSVASMIYNLEKNNRGTIIADQTGVGKGRQAAAMIRYALRNNMVPVFVTAKANLFTDMYDDMLDIGETSGKPFIFNNDGGFIVDREGGKDKFKRSPAVRKAGLQQLASGKMPAGANMLMLTYDQVNSRDARRLQRPAMEGLIAGGLKPMFIFDESHNVAGDRQKYNSKAKEMLDTTAGWVYKQIDNQPVMYLSATYAKRPDNMPIYYRTDIIDAVDDIDALEDAIARGGEALQTVVANMLTQSGQLWRRERSFDGISFKTTTFGFDADGKTIQEKEAERKEHVRLTDLATAGLREIVSVDGIVSEWLKDNGQNIVDELVGELGGEMENPGAMMESLMMHSPFTSRVHNFIKQLLLSMKADWIVEEAIALHKAGIKPVIGLENTMESFLKAEIERGNAAMGDPWTGDYRSILRAALATTRRVTLTNKQGDKERVTIPVDKFPPNIQELFARTEAHIDGIPIQDVVLFYIDYIRNKLEDAGIRTGEITGRELMVDYSDGSMNVQNRPQSNKKFRRTLINDFNDGKVDALILNAAGSTGMSIHASEKFKDQKPRHMLIAQAMNDINIMMQLLGRTNRTGQVVNPSYEMMGLDLPSEQRPLAMTARKMRSLNANTSANTESETSLNVASILNKHGDTVVKELLIENKEWQTLTSYHIEEKSETTGIAMKFTGKLALAPVKAQNEIWKAIQENYSEYIDWLDATNQNDLKTDVIDLDAKIIENKVVYEGKDPTSIFGGNTVMHKITANAQGRSPTAYDMTQAVDKGLDGETSAFRSARLIEEIRASDTTIADLEAERDKWMLKAREATTIDAKTDEERKQARKDRTEAHEKAHELRTQQQAQSEMLRQMVVAAGDYRIGTAWKLDLGDQLVTGVVTSVTHAHEKGKGSPFSPSKLKIKFIVNSPATLPPLPLSKIDKGEIIERRLYSSPSQLNNLFDAEAGPAVRETMYVATGNLLGGYNSIEEGGRVVSFTAANGKTYSGILMPRKYGKKGEFDNNDDSPVVMRDPKEVAAYLRGSADNFDLRKLGVFNMPGQEVKVRANRGGYYSNEPSSGYAVSILRKRSTISDRVKYDKKLHEAMGSEFVGRTQVLTVNISDERLDATLKRLTELVSLYVPGSGIEALQNITGKSRTEAAISFDGTMKDDESLREDFSSSEEDLFSDTSGVTNRTPSFNLADGISFKVKPGRSSEKGQVTFLTKQLEHAMGRFMKSAVASGTFEQVSTPARLSTTVQAIERVFGRRVVFYRTAKPIPFSFNGVMLPRDPKTLYVDIDSTNPFAGVVGHELLHSLRRTHPEVYKKLAHIAQTRLKADGFDRFKAKVDSGVKSNLKDRKLSDDKMFEEMVANVIGDALLDPRFIREIASEGQTVWKQVWNAVLDVLMTFRSRMQVRGMGTTEYFTHVETLITEVQSTLRSHNLSMPVRSKINLEEDEVVFEDLKEDGEEIDLTEHGKSFMKRAGMPTTRKSLAAHVKDLMELSWGPVRKALSDSIQLGLFDKFYGIKRAYREYAPEIANDISGYLAARLSTGSASVMRFLLLHGSVKLDGDILEMIEGTKGLTEVFKPVQAELNNFLGWKIARRADRLYEEGKENNFTREEIDAGLLFAEGRIEVEGVWKSREDVYEKVDEEFVDFKTNILDLAEAAGLIDAITRPVWDKADWIPFYRVDQARKGKEGGVKFGGGMGLSHQTSGIRKLIGGEEAMSDPLGNIIMNFNHLVTASMKNLALLKTVDHLKDTPALSKTGYAFRPARIPRDQVKQMLIEDGIDERTIALLDAETNGEIFEGVARMWQLAEPSGKEVVKVMRDGKPEFYTIKDPMLLKSLTNVDIDALGGLFKPARAAKSLLTSMVTAEPGFMLRNFIRDTLHAWVISEDNFKPGIDGVRGLRRAAMESGGMLHMMAAGGSFQGGFINGTDPEAARKSVRAALRAQGYDNHYIEAHIDTIVDFTAGTWDKWRRVGDAVENANREAVYEAAIKAGKSKAQAIFEAKDLMDFSMHGSWKAIQMLNDILPFFNARLQGLYKLGRSGAVPIPGLIAKEIAMKGLWIALFSIMLEWLNSDNDEYNALEEWEKDTYWHFFPGTPYWIRVPKPFEVGVIYGTIPARMYRAMMGQDTPEKFFDRMGHALSDTLAFDPVPQIVKPALEVWANESRFTGRPIETMGDARKQKRDRFSASTSETMVALAPFLEKMGLSPKQGQHMLRGYLGTLGSYSLMAADVITRDIIGQPPIPAPSIRQWPVVGSFIRGEGPAYNTRYGTELYEMHKEVTLLWGSIKSYEDIGNYEAAGKRMEDPDSQAALSAKPGLSAWAKQRGYMRKELDQIYRDKDMTADEKKVASDKILDERNRMDAENYKYFSPLFGRK